MRESHHKYVNEIYLILILIGKKNYRCYRSHKYMLTGVAVQRTAYLVAYIQHPTFDFFIR